MHVLNAVCKRVFPHTPQIRNERQKQTEIVCTLILSSWSWIFSLMIFFDSVDYFFRFGWLFFFVDDFFACRLFFFSSMIFFRRWFFFRVCRLFFSIRSMIFFACAEIRFMCIALGLRASLRSALNASSCVQCSMFNCVHCLNCVYSPGALRLAALGAQCFLCAVFNELCV